ncbi:hypothetical protein [Corallococcus sp. EGB]|uniref:class III lanthionine synthetase LanKC N-terminal domain-containing protein n=1 Tax=Corallococcus sp. EGB TaxID=1521117 RepID=UPI001CBA7E21|nr:hypothetical protein [Corallococcus sp. EGB]
MEEISPYTLSDPDYFETLGRFPGGEQYSSLLKQLLPADWTVNRFDVFLQAKSERTVLKPQGFKIHVSSPVASAETTLRRIVPECVRRGVMFKIVAAPMLLRFQNSKRYSRGGSGKFVTIYPPDEATFRDLIEALHQNTRDLVGPYVLSDKRYRDSKVIFYRYGGFQRMYNLRIDGMRDLMVRKPDGSWVNDLRLPYFELPDWVQDPFADMEEAEAKGESELLNNRYAVQEALAFTNTGGVYKAVDQRTGSFVALKEARPHTETWLGAERTVDATMALRQEHEILRRLEGLPCVPQPIELFEEWEHTFLAVSFFEGIPLAKLRAQDDFIIMTYMEDPARVVRFCVEWRDIALRLFDALESIHGRGVLVGDLSPGNVLIHRPTGALGFIDFEGALIRGGHSPFSAQWFNPGFRRPERRAARSLEPEDDYYATGMLLYNLICPIQNLFELDKSHPLFRVLDHFIEAGLPSQTRAIIQLLLEGRFEDARQSTRAWNPAA